MKYEKKTRAALKLRQKAADSGIDETTYTPEPHAKKLLNKANKKKRVKFVRKKDEENIFARDIDDNEVMEELAGLNEIKLKNRETTNLNYSKSYVKNIKFKPQKYKSNYLPYHLRWIFNNPATQKTNEIVLIQEIEALEVKFC